MTWINSFAISVLLPSNVSVISRGVPVTPARNDPRVHLRPRCRTVAPFLPRSGKYARRSKGQTRSFIPAASRARGQRHTKGLPAAVGERRHDGRRHGYDEDRRRSCESAERGRKGGERSGERRGRTSRDRRGRHVRGRGGGR